MGYILHDDGGLIEINYQMIYCYQKYDVVIYKHEISLLYDMLDIIGQVVQRLADVNESYYHLHDDELIKMIVIERLIDFQLDV
jgi:hypothetical protein